MQKILVVAFLVCMLFEQPAPAQTFGGVDNLGAGLYSCGQWTTARRQNDSYQDEQWVDGYVVAQEVAVGILHRENIVLSTDAYGIYAWLDNYCMQNPTDNLLVATQQFVEINKPFLQGPNN